MPKFIRLLKLQKDKNSPRDEKSHTICSQCEKRDASGPDGLCNHCRFDNALTQIRIERK